MPVWNCITPSGVTCALHAADILRVARIDIGISRADWKLSDRYDKKMGIETDKYCSRLDRPIIGLSRNRRRNVDVINQFYITGTFRWN